jgi:hypothetical protein
VALGNGINSHGATAVLIECLSRQRSAGADESNAPAKCHGLIVLPPFERSSQTITAVKRVGLEHVEERIGEFLSGDCLDFGEALVHRGLLGMENFMPAGVGQYAFLNDKRAVGVPGGNVAQRGLVSRGVSMVTRLRDAPRVTHCSTKCRLHQSATGDS